MTQEQKELLLKDLCARLPYEVKVKWRTARNPAYLEVINKEKVILYRKYTFTFNWECSIEDIKPYLRPLLSMTEREKEEFEHITGGKIVEGGIVQNGLCIKFATINVIEDWLNAHHFDFRGLIPMGLAIEVTEENNPYKE